MSAQALLIELIGGAALLLWATRMVRTGILRAFGSRLRHILAEATGNSLRATVAGMGSAAVLQSSTATALLVVGFTGRGLVALAPALAVMLGADLGSTLVVRSEERRVGKESRRMCAAHQHRRRAGHRHSTW